MAAQPGEGAQTAVLKHARRGGKNMSATEMKRNQQDDELPCLSNYALWKEFFYEEVQQRCLSLQEAKVKTICAQKEEEDKVKKREACDWLFKEWFSEEKESLDTRIYLLDKLLPTLVPGVEKLLMEVERKNVLAPDKEPTPFNPINFLGEYLMRYNPRYGISSKPGPYLRGMRMVTKELKAEMPGTTSERLARMKAEAKNKRQEREQVENMKSQVKEMRKEALAVQFKEWTVDVSGRIPVAMVQSALRSFPDIIASASIDVRKAIYDRKLEIIDTLEKKVNIDEFTEYVHSYTEHFSHDMFQEILKHLRQCADDFQEMIRHDMWRQMFVDLFLDCDCGKVGLLDRQKILALLTDFYDRSPVIARRGFCKPSQWPIIELQDIELVDLWGGLDQEVCEELGEKLVLTQTGISEGETLAHHPVDDNRKGTYRMRPSVTEGLLEASDLDGDTIHSEQPSFHEDNKTEKQTESAGADRQEDSFAGSASTGHSLGRCGEPGSEKQVEEEEFSLGREPDTETNREEDSCTLDREAGSEGQVSQEEENWITESANTISGPTPEATAMTSEDRAVADIDAIDSKQDPPVAEVLKETSARKESFSSQHGSQLGQQTSSETRLQDEDILQGQDKDLHPIMAEIQNHWAPCARSAFDESCLNLPQFVQLMETFVGENISLPTVKRLIAFIKEEYKQTEEEKMEQLEKAQCTAGVAQRKLLLEALFQKWDNNASGFVDLEEVDAVLSTFKEGMEKEALRN
ncbi:PREDICTED: EF-hand calcium-binding domain-containing protein 5-like, partial [Merops nubicus]|uniref:EF-hand calcium-binding domain-containing protein 5-like n=1 Tax=Merops nubicus TaxID=57421 RepID=UPI0004EFFD27